MTFYPKGLLMFFLFTVALAVALIPGWGAIAVAGCLVVECALLLGVAGFGRGDDTESRF